MKNILLLFAGILSLILIISCAKDEENLSGTISGIVTEYASSNTPIAGATVTVNGKGLSKTTGSDGRFEFTGLEPGTYTIAVKANNYQVNTKQVTVYAGQKASCDIQLEVEKINVEISPLNLVFDKTVEQLSFTITNQSNRDLTYNIASYMQELEVSPIIGSVKAKGQQAISVKVTNRSSVKKTASGQVIVNVGSDSYQVNITINGTEDNVTTGNVMGTISDYVNANAPIAGATVTLSTTGESKTTGSDGRYEFKDLTPATYTITVSANDYEGAKKDVNIEAGKTATCDFQLQKGATNVEVSPQNLTYASDVDQLSFTIKNGSSSTQQYTVSNVPDFASVSSSTGMISSKGSEAITVTILNRKQITERKSAQLKVNVGNNAFVVNLTVEPYQQESVNVDIAPQALSFDRDTEQLTFTLTSKNSRTLDYKITSDLSILSISPTSGTLKERGQSTITVNVQDRKKIDVDRVGKITIDIEGNTYVVTVNVAKYEIDINLSPQSLTFNNDTEQLTLGITNNNSQTLEYTATSDLDALTLSPSNGNIIAKGRKDITIKVKDRKNIMSDLSGKISVAIAGRTYTADVFINKAQTSVSINPQRLSFDKNTDQMTFIISNSNIWSNDFSVSSNLSILSVSPTSGTISAKGQQTITVKVNDRQNVTTEQSGKLTVNIGSSTINVDVNIAKYEQDTPSDKENVTRGLVAYYNFNKGNADDAMGNYHGFENGGSYITDTPSGSGKALYLKQKQYISIGSAPLDKRTNYSISMWVKDFGAGRLIRTPRGQYDKAPTLSVTEQLKLGFCTGDNNYSGQVYTFNADMSNYQSGQWVMLTIVCEPYGNNTKCTLYVNGRRADSGTSGNYDAGGGTSMTIGGSYGNSYWSNPMKIDNVRFYSVSLTDDEVEKIYQYEK